MPSMIFMQVHMPPFAVLPFTAPGANPPRPRRQPVVLVWLSARVALPKRPQPMKGPALSLFSLHLLLTETQRAKMQELEAARIIFIARA